LVAGGVSWQFPRPKEVKGGVLFLDRDCGLALARLPESFGLAPFALVFRLGCWNMTMSHE
jgi:hypothetical protein